MIKKIRGSLAPADPHHIMMTSLACLPSSLEFNPLQDVFELKQDDG